ncbi:MAG TPA: hypothetical protein VJU59_29380 [Paraburkholderia sp.]|uniref:hypothetical protein n=1 Tax=Paraburkholderia sp. TaxID=1926495 RepID=UPI002B478C13|nr:hypothetical protein [Paraburkholderia sp.]HKR43741.1 hypothetical protein [Paraburkholderia sp.]
MQAHGSNTPAELEAQKELQERVAAQYANFAGYFIKDGDSYQKVGAQYANDDDVVALYRGPKLGRLS